MPAIIETTIRNGEIIATTQKMIQARLEEFAKANRRLKELNVSVNVGNPAKPEVQIKAPIGEQELVSQASADNVVQAVDDAIRRLQHILQDRKDQIQEATPEDRDNSSIKIGVVVIAILLAGIFGLSRLRPDSRLPKVVDVDVTVLHQGEPLSGATVIFASKTGGSLVSGAMATGITDSNGRPTMMTQVSPRTAAEGVAPGEFKITISKYVPPDGMSDQDYQDLVDADMEAANNGLTPDSSLPEMVELLSETYSSSSETNLEVAVTESGENKFTFDLQ